ncbi:MAG: LysM peptidoglycan-binding domain-containing protein [Gammaproteobacteria bacterium]
MPIQRIIFTACLIVLAGCQSNLPKDSRDHHSQRDPIRVDSTGFASSSQPASLNDWAIEAHESASPAGYDNLWDRIRAGLVLPRNLDNELVRKRIEWYSKHQSFMDRVAERAEPYLYHIVEELEARGLPLDLALLPIVESAYEPLALSPSQAAGIWQFIPSTGRHYGLKQNWWYDGRRDIHASTDAALTYLDYLNEYFDGDWLHAIAAYNGGEGTVGRAVASNAAADKDTAFWALNLRAETRGYVPALMAIAEIIARPDYYQISLQPITNQPYFTQIETGGQVDLKKAADLADIPLAEISRLNPGFKRWATDPEGPHALLVPVDKAEKLAGELLALPKRERLSWQQHRVRQGETLGQIAARYGTTVAVIQQTNKLRGHLIRTGQDLIIAAPGAAPAIATAAAPAQPGNNATAANEYTVRNGDSLWQIARQHNLRIADISRLNNLGSKAVLQPGQTLQLVDQQDTATNLVKTATHSLESNSQPVKYTVQQGDSLWAISRRFQVSLAALQEWNRLPVNTTLRPGQEIKVYVDAEDTPHDI